MRKKVLIILCLLVILSFAAGVILISNKKPALTVSQNDEPREIKNLIDEPVISPIPSYDQTALWYFTPKSRLFRVNADGTGLSEFPLPTLAKGELRTVVWPVNGNDFIAVTMSGATEFKNYYDSKQKKYVTLPPNVQSFDWLPDGRRIAYIWKSGDNVNQQLVVANADGTGFKVIANVFWPDLKVKVSPSGKEALLIRDKIYRVNFETGQFDTIVEEGKNLGAVWVSAEKFVFAQANPSKLFLYNFSNRSATDLNLSSSLDKLLIDAGGKVLYAAVPKSDNTGDEFVKVDLNSFKKEKYFGPQQDVRAKNLIMVAGQIYFVSIRDSKLYYISK